jgi:hypothetical protein
MEPEEYLRQYTTPFAPPDLGSGSESPRDGTALRLERGYYYPPYLKLETYLDVLGPHELLQVIQELLAAEGTASRFTRRQVAEHLESIQRLGNEREWWQVEANRLDGELARSRAELAQSQADAAAVAMELAHCRDWMERYASELQRNQVTLALLENSNATLLVNVAELRASTSWKITAPLRGLGRWVKAVRNAG